MLPSFMSNKKREMDYKTVNIEAIQSISGSFIMEDSIDRIMTPKKLKVHNKLGNTSSNKSNTAATFNNILSDTKSAIASGYSMESANKIKSNYKNGISGDEKINVNYDSSNINYNKSAEISLKSSVETSTNERKEIIINHAVCSVKIPYSSINSARLLPKQFKLISKLYKVLETTYKFNIKRGLSLVFIKYKDSIEKLFGHRVDDEYLERLNYILNNLGGHFNEKGSNNNTISNNTNNTVDNINSNNTMNNIEFIPVSVMHNGELTNTYTIKITEGVNIDLILFNYYMGCYNKWLIEQGIYCEAKRIHPDFRNMELEIPRKSLKISQGKLLKISAKLSEKSPTKQSLIITKPIEISKEVKKTAQSIYDRIKEKERLRKEAFIAAQTNISPIPDKVEKIFIITKKKAIKMDYIIFQLKNIQASRSQIIDCLSDNYEVSKISGIEYVIKK